VQRAYDSDWAIFTAWCDAHGLVALPASSNVVTSVASDQAKAGLNPATIARRVAAIARLGQQHAAAGYDPTQFAGHSLRAGFLTEGAAQGATIFKLQEVSPHKSVQVLSDYVRNAELFKDYAGERFL
jgi:site-specific recombinase XerD